MARSFLTVVTPEKNSGLIKLERAVCNHGFFMMAPNLWLPELKSLVRPMRLIESDESVIISISQPLGSFLQIDLLNLDHHERKLSPQNIETICEQVGRMLRISDRDEMQMQEFHKIHIEAKKKGFGRIFRSPTLFEDMVKSVLLCNCSWSRSLEMAKALCELQYKLFDKKMARSKRKRCKNNRKGGLDEDIISKIMAVRGNFPSPKELAGLDEHTLDRSCNLGYRAAVIIKLARDIHNGTLDLKDLECEDHLPDKLFQRLMTIKGFGPFCAANVMMCIGIYQQIPVDTETIKHLQKVHGKTKLKKENLSAVIEQIYGKYEPFQCLAYWFEHVEYYEKKLGKLSKLPRSKYRNVSTSIM